MGQMQVACLSPLHVMIATDLVINVRELRSDTLHRANGKSCWTIRLVFW